MILEKPQVRHIFIEKFYTLNVLDENGEFFNKLKALIEETYENAKQRPVVLLPHSMGCLFAQWFLKKCDIPWKKKYIKSLVFSSCPFGGSVKTVKIEASGKYVLKIDADSELFKKLVWL